MSETPPKRKRWVPPSWLSYTSHCLVLVFGYVAVQAWNGTIDALIPSIGTWPQDWKSFTWIFGFVGLVFGLFNLFATFSEKQRIEELEEEKEREQFDLAESKISKIKNEIEMIADINPQKWTPELVSEFHKRLVELCRQFLEDWKVSSVRVSYYALTLSEVPPKEGLITETGYLSLAAHAGRKKPRHTFTRVGEDHYRIFDVFNQPNLHSFPRDQEEMENSKDPLFTPTDDLDRWKRCVRVGVKDVRTTSVHEERDCRGVLIVDIPTEEDLTPGAKQIVELFAELLSLTLHVSVGEPSNETLRRNFSPLDKLLDYNKDTIVDSSTTTQGGKDE